MARRRTGRRIAYTRRGVSRSRGIGKSFMGGTVGNVIDGAAVGAIQAIIPDDMLFGMADPLVMIGWGWFRKNPTLQTLGGYQLGQKIMSGGLGGIVGGKSGSQGGMY